MRNYLILSVVLAFFSCARVATYTIDGVVANDKLNGKSVYLCKYVGRELVVVDSTVIQTEKFNFQGSQDSAVLRVIRVDDEHFPKLPFILENGTITTKLDSIPLATGTALNDTLNGYKKSVSALDAQYEVISTQLENLEVENKLTPELEAKLKAQIKKLESESQSISLSYIRRNLNNEAGAYIFWLNRGTFTPELQQKLLDQAGSVFKADPFVKIIIGRLKMMKQVMVGMKFVDLTMPNPEGKMVSLSDFAGKGKVTLIDFWASWCGPCRAYMPKLIKIYEKYQPKGFQIVGVSFDKKKEDWLKGIQELGIPWNQMSDLSYWNSKGAEQYAVRAIPHTVLLDKNGIIVANDLEGADLEKTLDELLK